MSTPTTRSVPPGLGRLLPSRRLEALFFRFQVDHLCGPATAVRGWAARQPDLRRDWAMIARLESLVAHRQDLDLAARA